MKESIENLIESRELNLSDYSSAEELYDALEEDGGLSETVSEDLCEHMEECHKIGILENLDLHEEALPVLKEIWSDHHACTA